MANNLFRFFPASLMSATLLLSGVQSANAQALSFAPVNRYVVGGAVAEIIDSSPDGNTIVFTNAGDQQIGFIDITDPQNPAPLGTVDVSDLGEPTSVAITPDGRYAIAAVLNLIDEDAGQTIADQQPGMLLFIDLATRSIAGQVKLLGIGPDSVAIAPDGSKVVVAIEDEEDTDNLPGSRPGSINFVTINYDNPGASTVTNVPLDLSGIDGVNYVNDPQPEYVTFSPDGSRVAVTIQENNAIALIDVASETVTRIFSAGTAARDRADLQDDGDIKLVEAFEGRREPDAIAFTPDGQYLVTANEGDTDLESFGDNIWSGGRGWTIFDLEGNVVYDSGDNLDDIAVRLGQYPDGRSDARGIEIEGGTVATFGNTPLAFVASERGSFIAVYDISTVQTPEIVAMLPTGISPEGVLAIPERGLLLTANEGDGTIDIFQTSSDPTAGYSPTAPLAVSTSANLPFSAISGLHQVRDNAAALYAVPDNAMAPSRIFRINLDGAIASVASALPITKNGELTSYDLEGITLHPPGGFWVVSEGDDREGQEAPNLLIQVNGLGEVLQEIPLPEADASAITRFGFEGVTTNTDGTKVYVAVQREFEGDPDNTVRIAEYDLAANTWSYYYYPLDTDSVEESWVGLSEIARDADGSYLIVERDNQGGENGSANARIKRIYRINLEDAEPGSTLEKTLVLDLLKDHRWIEEKIESLAVTDTGYWFASDNDGGINGTRMLFVPRTELSQSSATE